jgi:hypothetical protein
MPLTLQGAVMFDVITCSAQTSKLVPSVRYEEVTICGPVGSTAAPFEGRCDAVAHLIHTGVLVCERAWC